MSKDSPLVHHISFEKLLQRYDVMAKSDNEFLAANAKRILAVQKDYPFLREGFTDIALLEEHKDVIQYLLQDTFTEVLSENEIKVASLPYYDVIFNSSKRFQKIVKNAGPDFTPFIRNKEEGLDYIMSCVVILKFYFGFPLDFSRPMFYDIPDANGVMHHYRVLYNADFLEVLPTQKTIKITQDDVNELMDEPNNLELWKSKIPPNSFISKGFVISNMFDVTAEHSISEIKSELIESDKRGSDDFMIHLKETFKSFFKLPNIQIGFSVYNSKEHQLESVYGKGMISFILNGREKLCCKTSLHDDSCKKLFTEGEYIAIPDVDKYYEMSDGGEPFGGLKAQGIKSIILAPISSEGELLGMLEIASEDKHVLNGVNAKKLDDVMPYIVSAVLRTKLEEENRIDAIIQNECTSVHHSVHWKFQEEAIQFLKDELQEKQPSFKEIVFKDIYPLYGQIDIKDSSKARNKAIQNDLIIELSLIKDVLFEVWQKSKLPIYEELMFRVNNHLDSIKETLFTNSEQIIFDFVRDEISPVFKHLKDTDEGFKNLITEFNSQINSDLESYYDHRKNYDESVKLINKKLASVIDEKQLEAQEMFPHYFERFKTDGIEHNMYIGDSIAEGKEFNSIYLNNLRLWQLQVMCDMENTHYSLKPELGVKLDVASLILVYNASLSIRFRMDEKRFDVDGTYNARYEVIKKRIDKSYIKGTKERLTQVGKMVIVYSQKKDELEYLRYIKFLKSKGYFTGKIEIVELEGLQGVSGLKAIRAEILYSSKVSSEKTFTYQDLMNELRD